jgi:hypothetical protein
MRNLCLLVGCIHSDECEVPLIFFGSIILPNSLDYLFVTLFPIHLLTAENEGNDYAARCYTV